MLLMFSVLSLNMILTRFLFKCTFKTEFCYSAFLQHELSVTTANYKEAITVLFISINILSKAKIRHRLRHENKL